MNLTKNTLFIAGAVALMALLGLTLNYTELIKSNGKDKTATPLEESPISSNDNHRDVTDLEFEFQQKEKCLKLKQDFMKQDFMKDDPDDGITEIMEEENVIYSEIDNTCYLYLRELSMAIDGSEIYKSRREYIFNLLTEEEIIWYPSADRWTYSEFLQKKKELGF